MSKFEDLVELFCPNGVPVKRLGDVLEVFNGYAFKAESFNSIQLGVPIIRIRDVNSGFSSTYFEGEYDEKYLVQNEDLLIGMDGDFQITRWKHGQALLNQRVCRLQNFQGILPSFVFHYIPAELTAIQNATNSGTVNHISSKQIGDILIPVPPIEVQHEIVIILDKFIHLESELEAELEARKTQYQYFCNSLFTFKDGETEALAIKDICRISRGTVISKDYLRDRPGEFPVYSSQTLNNGIFGYIDTFAYDFESLTWTTDGANAGSIFFHQNEKFTITNVCGLLQVLDPSRVSARYIYYVLRTEAPKHVSAGMGNPKLMAGTMGDVKLRIPSMERQLEVVAILDKFDALLNDISVGLPVEISARRQQYEYYRSKLLTFKELDVA